MKARGKHSKFAAPRARKGKCRICGCTETTPCMVDDIVDVRPCAWADESKTLCTNPKCLAADVKQRIKAAARKAA